MNLCKSKFLWFCGAALMPLILGLWYSGCSVSMRGGGLGDSNARLNKAMVKEELSRLEHGEEKVPGVATAHYYFLLGEMALQRGSFEEALEHYEAAIRYENSSAPTLRRRLAEMYLRSGRLDDALAQIDKALESRPEDADLLQLRAGILATLKRTDEAIEAYRKVIELSDPKNEDPYIFLASLYIQEQNVEAAREVLEGLIKKHPTSFFGIYYLARVSLAGGELEEAEKYYKKALELNPNAETVQLELARAYAFQKRFDEAIELCEKTVKHNPDSIKANELLGELLLAKDRVDDALKVFEAVGALEDDPTETRLKIAIIKMQRRDLEGAVVDLRLILSQHPENTTARYYLASAYAGLKKEEESVEQLKQIKPGEQLFVESRTLGTYLLRQLERYEEAIVMLEELLSVKPKNIKLLMFLAALQRDAGDVQGAVETAKRIIELKPDEDSHYFMLGVYYDEMKDKDEAMNAMRKAIELNPKNANALNYLGYTLAELGQQLEEAEDLIKRALEIEKDNGYFIDSLGWVYYQMGRYQDALRELERAAAIVPEDAVILEHVGLALLKVGRVDEAREVLTKALGFAPDSDDKKVGPRIEKTLEQLGADAQ